MNLKTSLVNKIVVTLVTLMAFIQCAVVLPQSTKMKACITAYTACESLMIHQLVQENESIFLHVTLLTFLVSPQASFKSAFVVTMVAFVKTLL